ncbi:thioredoxin-like 3-2, chloroplastic isoform X2 [Rutidosis leptorrhynchoides]|uniref:thioredoxin-like 3-2, chloroplastic isoform X2 n=1 Tax=Rutidosis leptorrhynchoides TaxID=125765 RepID=UPI003A991B35
MSNAARIVPISSFQAPKSLNVQSNRVLYSTYGFVSDYYESFKINKGNNHVNNRVVRMKSLTDFSQQGSILGLHDGDAVSIALKPILNENQFDHVIAEAQQLDESVVILWMANWCRKCIYLKPKLEKLAAHYHPRVQFYCIDVNNVPHKLIVRAGVTKMPTIQLWKDSKKQAEVIGGHKAYLVVNEVREMIEDEGEP